MLGDLTQTRLPIYHTAVDWEAFFREYPVADVWAETVYQWPIDRVRDLQNERFVKLIARGWRNPFYQRRWQSAGLQPSDIRGLEDIGKLPTFTSEDIKDDQQQHPPFGDIQGSDWVDVRRTPLKVQTSGGTTGKPRPTLFGPTEWEIQALASSRSLYLMGARPGDVMQIPATCSLANVGWAFYKACHDYLGVLPLTTGSGLVTPSRRQVELAFDWGTNLWMSFPEYMTQLARVARDELGRDVRELGTRFILSFLGPDLEGTLRRTLEDLWGCPVYDNYGTHEMGEGAFECPHKQGLHFMEDLIYFEILDTDTNQPLPDGQAGNIVATILFRDIPPMIRYNARDLGRIVGTGACGCGSQFRRMDHFLGRSDDMVKLRGVNVYPMACLPAIKSDPRTTGEWICVVDRFERDGVLRDEMAVRTEVRRDAGGREGLQAHLEQRLQNDLGVKVAVELVEEGSLADLTNFGKEGKARRLLDRRFARTSP